jgi:hypothetical protein
MCDHHESVGRIRVKSICCQIDTIRRQVAWALDRGHLSLRDGRTISGALCNASLDVESSIERRISFADDIDLPNWIE